MKKFLVLILSLVMMLGCVPVMAQGDFSDGIAIESNEVEKISMVCMPSFPEAHGETSDAERIKYVVSFLNSLELVPDDTDMSGTGGSAMVLEVYYSDGTTEEYVLYWKYLYVDGKQYCLSEHELEEFRKIVYVLNGSMDIPERDGIVHFAIPYESYEMVRIDYIHGQGMPSPTSSRPDYNYTTLNQDEIKTIIECVNEIDLVPSNLFGSNDGVYMTIFFGGTDLQIYFDVSVGKCSFNGSNYEFDRVGYEKLANLIYTYKTKDDIKLYLDNERLDPHVAPLLIEDRTLVPVRIICEALGAQVSWDGENKSAVIIKDGIEVIFVMDEDYVIINGEKEALDIGSRLIKYTSMVPVRALSELFGFKVEWENNSVFINSK